MWIHLLKIVPKKASISSCWFDDNYSEQLLEDVTEPWWIWHYVCDELLETFRRNQWATDRRSVLRDWRIPWECLNTQTHLLNITNSLFQSYFFTFKYHLWLFNLIFHPCTMTSHRANCSFNFYILIVWVMYLFIYLLIVYLHQTLCQHVRPVSDVPKIFFFQCGKCFLPRLEGQRTEDVHWTDDRIHKVNLIYVDYDWILYYILNGWHLSVWHLYQCHHVSLSFLVSLDRLQVCTLTTDPWATAASASKSMRTAFSESSFHHIILTSPEFQLQIH